MPSDLPATRRSLADERPTRAAQSCAVQAVLAVIAGLFVTSCVVTATVPPSYPASGLEWNVNRRGADYRDFDLITPSPETCQSTCMSEPQCVAFTYVNPGVQGPNARCWLKSAVPEPAPDTCCVSGVKYATAAAPPPPPPAPAPAPAPPPPPPASNWQGQPVAPPAPPPASNWQGQPVAPPPGRQWEPHTDRPGSNYRDFDLPTPRPETCRDACWAEPQCRAFTYVRPGVQGPRARCWLKNVVPPARPADCCLSGVK